MKTESEAIGALSNESILLECAVPRPFISGKTKSNPYKESGIFKLILQNEDTNLFQEKLRQLCELLTESFPWFENPFENLTNLIYIFSRQVSERFFSRS